MPGIIIIMVIIMRETQGAYFLVIEVRQPYDSLQAKSRECIITKFLICF